MSATRRLRRTAALCVLACMLAALTFAAPASSAAPAEDAALATERYYSSYREPPPLTTSPASSSETPWVLVGLALAGAVVIAGGSAIRLRRRGAARTAWSARRTTRG